MVTKKVDPIAAAMGLNDDANTGAVTDDTVEEASEGTVGEAVDNEDELLDETLTDVIEEGEEGTERPIEELAPSINAEGHRNRFINANGDVTEMDDETAAMFYNEPKFYSYTFDAGKSNTVHVSTLLWCSDDNRPVGGQVGNPYRKADK